MALMLVPGVVVRVVAVVAFLRNLHLLQVEFLAVALRIALSLIFPTTVGIADSCCSAVLPLALFTFLTGSNSSEFFFRCFCHRDVFHT